MYITRELLFTRHFNNYTVRVDIAGSLASVQLLEMAHVLTIRCCVMHHSTAISRLVAVILCGRRMRYPFSVTCHLLMGGGEVLWQAVVIDSPYSFHACVQRIPFR